MKVREITDRIEKRIPRQAALEWDNVGLLVGDPDQEVHRIYVALDATDQVIDHAIGAKADMLITHHPMIFSPIRSVRADDFVGRRIIRLISHEISYYAMHTNYDVCEMGDLAADTLGMTELITLDVSYDGRDIDPVDAAGDGTDAIPPIRVSSSMGIGKVGEMGEAIAPSLRDYAKQVREAFGLSHVRVFGDPEREVHRVAICPGSGKSEVDCALAAGADTYVSGDIDHHTGLDAMAQGLAVIDAGHYGVEHIFIEHMAMTLRAQLAEIDVLTEPMKEPVWIV